MPFSGGSPLGRRIVSPPPKGFQPAAFLCPGGAGPVWPVLSRTVLPCRRRSTTAGRSPDFALPVGLMIDTTPPRAGT